MFRQADSLDIFIFFVLPQQGNSLDIRLGKE